MWGILFAAANMVIRALLLNAPVNCEVTLYVLHSLAPSTEGSTPIPTSSVYRTWLLLASIRVCIILVEEDPHGVFTIKMNTQRIPSKDSTRTSPSIKSLAAHDC